MFHRYYRQSRYLVDSNSKRLGNCSNRVCRFCDRSAPQVRFRKTAHLLPQSTGNRSLIVCYECDECNQAFGLRYEDAFGKFTKTHRMVLGIAGRAGIPAVGYRSNNAPARLESDRESEISLSIQFHERITEANLDVPNHSIVHRVPVDPYVPWDVLRSLYHSSYLALDASELNEYTKLKSWVTSRDEYPGALEFMRVFRSVGNSSIRRFLPFLQLFDRTHGTDHYKKCVVIGFSSIIIQFYLPSDQDFQQLSIGSLQRPKYSWPDIALIQRYGALELDEVDLSSNELQQGQVDEVKIPLPEDQWAAIWKAFSG